MKRLSSNAALNVAKSLFTVIASLVSYAYITRIFTVSDIGRMHFGESVISYLALIADLGIGIFAVRDGCAVRNDNAVHLFADRMFTISIISTAVSMGLLAVLAVFPSRIAEYRTVILIQGITVLFSPFAVEWVFTIYEDFTYIALRGIMVRAVSLALLFVFVKDETDFCLYLTLDACATGIGDIVSFIYSRRYLHLKPVRDMNWHEYGKPVMTLFLYNLTATVYVHADTVMLGMMQGDTDVAVYGVATKVYFTIKNLFNAALSVTVPRISALLNEDREKMKSLVSDVLSLSVIFTVPAAVGVILLRDDITELIAGSTYQAAACPLAVLAIALVFSILATVLSKNVLIVIGKEKEVAKITFAAAVINIALNLIFIPRFSYIGAAFTTALAEMTVFAGSLIALRRHLKGLFRARDLIDAVIGCAVMALAVSAVMMAVPGCVMRLLCGIPVGVVTYCLTLLLIKDRMMTLICKDVISHLEAFYER